MLGIFLPVLLTLLTVCAAKSFAAAPDAPTVVSGSPGNTFVRVSFTAPSNNGGSPVTSYTVVATPGNITATGAASPLFVVGLTNGTSYTFTVTASNSEGTSVPSEPSAPATPNVAAPVITYHAPAPYTLNVAIPLLSPTSGGGSVTSYAITPAPSLVGLTFNTGTGSLSGTPTAVQAATVYTIIATGPGGTDTATVTLTINQSAAVFLRSQNGTRSIHVNGTGKTFTFEIPALQGRQAIQPVTLNIVDTWGRTIWNKSVRPSPGKVTEVSWNGRTANGLAASAGVYLVQISGIDGVK